MSFPDPQTPVQTPAQVMPVQPRSPKGYVVLPPEEEVAPKGISPVFVIFAVVVFGMATVAGLVKGGRLQISGFGVKPVAALAASDPVEPAAPAAVQKPAPVSAAPVHVAKPVVAAAPVPSLPAGTFTVTSISLGNPSFAIINGQAKTVGEAVSANGVTGWRVRQISESTVVLQNGAGFAELQMTAPGLTPLNDKLNPLN